MMEEDLLQQTACENAALLGSHLVVCLAAPMEAGLAATMEVGLLQQMACENAALLVSHLAVCLAATMEQCWAGLKA